MNSSSSSSSSSSSPSSSSSSSSSSPSTSTKMVSHKKETPTKHSPPMTINKWKTPTQERIYTQRLLHSLHSLQSTTTTTTHPPPPRLIKASADSALAMTAMGRSRWSRSILAKRWRVRKMAMKAGGKIRRKKNKNNKKVVGLVHEKKKKVRVKVKDRLKLLSRLVPGCKKASPWDLLEETADYVAALELQVKAMKALAQALSSTSLS